MLTFKIGYCSADIRERLEYRKLRSSMWIRATYVFIQSDIVERSRIRIANCADKRKQYDMGFIWVPRVNKLLDKEWIEF